MKGIVRNGLFTASLCAGLLAAGCASYYKVTDPQSGREYYTEKVETLSGGAVKLKDARNGSLVTLQNSEVKEIDSDAFKAGVSAPAKPAAVPTSEPASAPSITPGH
jgi:hypothetical protein